MSANSSPSSACSSSRSPPLDGQLRLDDRLGKVAGVGLLHEAVASARIETGDDERHAVVEIDRAGEQQRLRGRQIHLAEHLPAATGPVDDGHIGGGGGAQRHPLGRIGAVGPVPAPRRGTHLAAFPQMAQQLAGGGAK